MATHGTKFQGVTKIRTLSATLTAAQKAGGKALCKAVFTKSGQSTRTYDNDSSTNRILVLNHAESEWSQTAQIVMDNRDGNLTSLDLTGYTCTISYGYNTSAGDEYSACAPLEGISQKQDTLLRQGQGSDLVTVFSCAGVFNLMTEDEASDSYNPEADNQDTVKTILTAIAEATMSCFSHCKAYTITFDSEDSLIDSFKPADYFKVGFRESRLNAFKKALKWTKCKTRIEDDGEIHIFDPTISGTSYDYEYNDAATYHNFFEKSVRDRLVIPNKVIVSSHPDQGNYTGNATDSTSYSALGRYVTQHHWLRVASNTQCTSIATAILQGYQVGQEKGHGYAPLNCGQEVMDYIKITDSVANDTVTGNIGYINRKYQPGVFEMEIRFGALELGGIGGIIPPQTSSITIRELEPTIMQIQELIEAYNRIVQIIESIITVLETSDSDLTRMRTDIELLFAYLFPGNAVHFNNLRVIEKLVIPKWSSGEP